MGLRETDNALWRRANLLHGSPGFAAREESDGRSSLARYQVISEDGARYWLAGTSVLANGQELASVFCVDTGAGGALQCICWKQDADWLDSQDALTPAQLGLAREDIFPFDYRFAIPLERDIFHDAPETKSERRSRRSALWSLFRNR